MWCDMVWVPRSFCYVGLLTGVWHALMRSFCHALTVSFFLGGGRLKTQVRKTRVPEDGICKYGNLKYESATVENVSTAT